ncbi:MAG: hypothetical protein KGY80_07695 [Candidatus Thorarchaeota archaeon]|nr:hypothetical protein [Candidatus Thorarchaeota archaeon]
MTDRHVFGSLPQRDPMDEMKESRWTVSKSSKARWRTRELASSWLSSLAISALAITVVFYLPQIIGILSGGMLLLLLGAPVLTAKYSEQLADEWEKDESIDSLVADERELVRTANEQYMIALSLEDGPAEFLGDLGRLVRALPMSLGFCLVVSLEKCEPSVLYDHDLLDASSEWIVNSLSPEGLESFLLNQAGLWKTSVSIAAQLPNRNGQGSFESAIHGALPAKGWERFSVQQLMTLILNRSFASQNPRFYALGNELTKWLIQLKSELASEVGSNVPGEFVSPIREAKYDLALGHSINPETMLEGPPVGLVENDLKNGLLICGGNQNERAGVLANLVEELLNSGKHVILLSPDTQVLDLASLHHSGIPLQLADDLILNPIDSDGMNSLRYVSRLKKALEVLNGRAFGAATDFELALQRAVSVPDATLADVTLKDDTPVVAEEGGSSKQPTSDPSRDTLRGMEVIRVLRDGVGARAFYGKQTVPMSSLAENPLAVITVELGSPELDIFVWDLLSIKLSGIALDNELVVILDSPQNLLAMNSRYPNRSKWVHDVISNLLRLDGLIISVDGPSILDSEVLNHLGSSICLRLRDSRDVAVANDILKLTVVGHGIHSKSRRSSRETSFVRTLDSDMAILSHQAEELSYPIQLNTPPTLDPLTGSQIRERLKLLQRYEEQEPKSQSLLAHAVREHKELAARILELLDRYEPLTEKAIQSFLNQEALSTADMTQILYRLEKASLILRGHESHSGVDYRNYRLTLKGRMALRQFSEEVSQSQ